MAHVLLIITTCQNDIHSYDRLRCWGDGSFGLNSFRRGLHVFIPTSPSRACFRNKVFGEVTEGSHIIILDYQNGFQTQQQGSL